MEPPDMHIWGYSSGSHTTLNNIAKALSYVPFFGIIANLWKKVQGKFVTNEEILNKIDPNQYHRTIRAVLECIPGVSTFLLPVDLIATLVHKMTSEIRSLEKSLEDPAQAEDLVKVLLSLEIDFSNLNETKDPKSLYVVAFLNMNGRMPISNGGSVGFSGDVDDALPYYFRAFDAIVEKESSGLLLTILEQQIKQKILNELKKIASGRGIKVRNNITDARSFFESHKKNPLVGKMIASSPWLTDMQPAHKRV